MIEAYKQIKNDIYNVCNTPIALNATAKIQTLKSQLKLQSPVRAISNQREVELEEDQLNNVEIQKANSGNVRQLKL